MTRRGDGIGLEVTTSVVRGVRLDPGRARPRRGRRRGTDQPLRRRGRGARRTRPGARSARTRGPESHDGHPRRVVPGRVHDAAHRRDRQHRARSSTRCATSSPSEPASRRRCWSRSKRADGCSSCGGTTSRRTGWNVCSSGPASSMRRSNRHRSRSAASSGSTTPVARRDASNGQSWAAVYDAGVPIAATSVPQASREYPGHRDRHRGRRRCTASTTSSARPSSPTSSTRWPPPRSRPPGRPACSNSRWCSPTTRIRRSRPTTCAHRSARRSRSAPLPEPPGWRDGSDRSTSSPRPVRRAAPDIRRPWAIERVVDLPPRVRLQRLPWWRRRGPLAHSRSRKPGRSPKTATAWRSGTKSRR